MTRGGAALLLAALAAAGCDGGGDAGPRGRRGPRGGPEAAVAVGVEAPRRETVRRLIVGHAPLEPDAQVIVSARAEGLVVELRVEAGDRVAEGDVLARLDDTRARLRVREAEVALAQARTSQARADGLAAKGLSTAEEQEQAREAVLQAELGLERARLDLADTVVRSPIAGVVTERLAVVGASLNVGAAAFSVADRRPLLVRLRVPEAEAERVVVGQPARVRVEGLGVVLRGEVQRVAPVVELGSGTVVVTVAVAEGADQVRIGRFATVEVIVEERADALTIPQAALALRGEEERVLVLEGGALRTRAVQVGIKDGDRLEVVSGLGAEDLVVVAAPDDARDGTAARAVRQDGVAAVGTPAAPAPAGADGEAEGGADAPAPRRRRRPR